MRTFAAGVVRWRWWVIAGWVAAVVGLQLGSLQVGTDYKDVFDTPGTDSQSASDVLEESFPSASGDADLVVWRVASGTATDEEARRTVDGLLASLSRVDSVSSVTSPLDGDRQTAGQVSSDKRTAYATVQFDRAAAQLDVENVEEVVELVEDADEVEGLDVGISGQGAARLSTPALGILELVGVAFAAVVLYISFGSLVAASMPLLSAIGALGSGVAVVGLLSNALDLPTAVPTIGVLLGLGVGIDYALFLVSRFRRSLRAGSAVDDAVVDAVDSSGRAVIFAGITVVISLLGLLLVGLDFLDGVGIGVAIVVLSTVFAAVTLLPAMLSVLGHRVLSGKHRRELAEGSLLDLEHANDNPTRWVRFLRDKPVVATVVGAAAMVALALPVGDLRLGVADQGSNPDGSVTRVGYDLLADGFGPGVNGPLLLVAQTRDDDARAAVEQLRTDLVGTEGVASVGPVQANQAGDTALLRVVPTTNPQDEQTVDLIETIRDDIVPDRESAAPGLTVDVGGSTATFKDFSDLVTDALPLFLAAVILLSVVLLMVAFRSLLIPLLGGVMNLLGAAAALGVVIAVFQWGWGSDLLGVGREGPIEPFIPVMAFAILFGLSMDYQVFLVSRVHEEWLRTKDNRRAVIVGLNETRPVITAAALIMVFVFGSFVTGDSRTIKLIGFGLAVGVFLDAYVLRQTVVPGSMLLAGKANWYLPAWLDRILPNVSVEGPHQPATAGAPLEAARHGRPADPVVGRRRRPDDDRAREVRAPGEQVLAGRSTTDLGTADQATANGTAVRGAVSGAAENGLSENGAGGYHAGFRAGHEAGHAARFEEGHRVGWEAGRRARFEEGRRDGYAAGVQARYEEGFRDGYENAVADGDERYRTGHDAGYEAALSEDPRAARREATAPAASRSETAPAPAPAAPPASVVSPTPAAGPAGQDG
ncbi:MAG: MMPL family transporter, partial [Phycicoccus sp.]